MTQQHYNIYKLTFPNGRSYVGATKQTVAGRVMRHQCNNFTRLVAEHFGIYGPKSGNPETLASNVKPEDYREVEKFFIDLHGTMEDNGGLNIMNGSEWTDLMKARQSDTMKKAYARKKRQTKKLRKNAQKR